MVTCNESHWCLWELCSYLLRLLWSQLQQLWEIILLRKQQQSVMKVFFRRYDSIKITDLTDNLLHGNCLFEEKEISCQDECVNNWGISSILSVQHGFIWGAWCASVVLLWSCSHRLVLNVTKSYFLISLWREKKKDAKLLCAFLLISLFFLLQQQTADATVKATSFNTVDSMSWGAGKTLSRSPLSISEAFSNN